MKKTGKQRLFEVMGRVDRNFKPKMNEDSYGDYLDTNYSADGMEDYDADNANDAMAEKLYDIGELLYQIGRKDEAEKYRQEAISKSTAWDDADLPPYSGSQMSENKVTHTQKIEGDSLTKTTALWNNISEAIEESYFDTINFPKYNKFMSELGEKYGFDGSGYIDSSAIEHLSEEQLTILFNELMDFHKTNFSNKYKFF